METRKLGSALNALHMKPGRSAEGEEWGGERMEERGGGEWNLALK